PVELRALQLVRDSRHPHLVATFGVWQKAGFLIIAMELANCTLLDRHVEAVRQGLPGIPGPKLLAYMKDAAEGIDFLNASRSSHSGKARAAIKHPDSKPQNLLLIGDSVKVADFGLARRVTHAITGHSGSMTPSYAAPEFFKEETSRHSDQYSLAVTYCLLR